MSKIDSFEVTGLKWVDDDGTVYQRVFSDGEIKDIEVA